MSVFHGCLGTLSLPTTVLHVSGKEAELPLRWVIEDCHRVIPSHAVIPDPQPRKTFAATKAFHRWTKTAGYGLKEYKHIADLLKKQILLHFVQRQRDPLSPFPFQGRVTFRCVFPWFGRALPFLLKVQGVLCYIFIAEQLRWPEANTDDTGDKFT